MKIIWYGGQLISENKKKSKTDDIIEYREEFYNN